MPARTPRRLLTPQELEIMKVVWERPTASVRDVYEELRMRRRVAYTTVMTLMQILEKKGHLKRTVDGRRHLYRPAKPRRGCPARATSAQVCPLARKSASRAAPSS